MHRTLLPLLALLGGCAAKMDLGYESGADYAKDTDTPQDADDFGPGRETEDDLLAMKPAQTDVYVFVANPERDTVTRVHVFDLAVDTTPVGRDPRIVHTTPDYATAVVFNRGDDSVTLIDADTLDKRTVPVRDNFNTMVLSPDGNWATLWHDIASERLDDPEPDGIISYNEASFVHIPSGAHFPMAVGFNPKMVRFTPDGTLAVVVSDATLALVDLTVERPLPELIEVAANPLNPPSAEEVEIAPDGSYAFVRQFGAPDLVVVDLASKAVNRVPVGLDPTDLDLSPDGLKASVVARGDSQLWVYDVADPFLAPSIVDLPINEGFGSLLYDPRGQQAIVYTTAAPVDRYAVWDLTDDSVTLRSLVKPVANMAITPTGESLLVFHTLDNAPGSSPSVNPFHDQHALTVISLDSLAPNPLQLPAEIIGYANSSNGNYGYFVMDGERFLEVLDYRSLLYEEIPLKSEPAFVGALPDVNNGAYEPPAWVSQEHDLGRITFYNPDEDSTETITGFELNAHVQTGGN